MRYTYMFRERLGAAYTHEEQIQFSFFFFFFTQAALYIFLSQGGSFVMPRLLRTCLETSTSIFPRLRKPRRAVKSCESFFENSRVRLARAYCRCTPFAVINNFCTGIKSAPGGGRRTERSL